MQNSCQLIEKTRESKASVFRNKSDEAFEAAKECLLNKRYRATCNRAWYSIYQAVSAGAYLALNEEPPNGRDNWNHDGIGKVFRKFLYVVNWKTNFRVVFENLRIVREARIKADYSYDEEKFGYPDANVAITTAEEIRYIIYRAIGWENTSQLK